tara:strand:+ start:1688 stop:1963 length:276 start_codon:yes stop_codon:yes gene_type:complete
MPKKEAPDFSEWPPHDNFSETVVGAFAKTYIRMKVDAEWRAQELGDRSYLHWLTDNFDLSGLISYIVLAQHMTQKDIDEWENKIRCLYDWD